MNPTGGLWRRFGCAVGAVVLSLSFVSAQYGAKTDGEWPTYGGDLGNT